MMGLHYSATQCRLIIQRSVRSLTIYDDMEQDVPARKRISRRKGKAKKLKFARKPASRTYNRKRIAAGKDEPYKQYTPCGCKQTCGKECPCNENGTCCEKYCGNCKNRFRGCHCAKGQCRSRQCPCFTSARECDPNICRNCWVRKALQENELNSEVNDILKHFIDASHAEIKERCEMLKERYKEKQVKGSESSDQAKSEEKSFIDQTLTSALDFFANLFCRCCLIFDCHLHGCSQDPIIPEQDVPARKRISRRKGKAKKLKFARKSAGRTYNRKRIAAGKDEPYKQYTPCGCKQTCGKECPCNENGTCCEKYCGCGKGCENRFRGCHCAKGQCRSRQCPCFASARECDPDIFRNCWVRAKLKFANHSSNPNCYAKVMFVAGDHRVGIFAKENIDAGEELFYDYRYGRDEAPAWARKPERLKRDFVCIS